MNALLIGLYAIYFILVGLNGNANQVIDEVASDTGGFLPWAVGIGTLAVMYEYEATKKIAQPFILLLIISFIVSNFDKLQSEFQRLQTLAKE